MRVSKFVVERVWRDDLLAGFRGRTKKETEEIIRESAKRAVKFTATRGTHRFVDIVFDIVNDEVIAIYPLSEVQELNYKKIKKLANKDCELCGGDGLLVVEDECESCNGMGCLKCCFNGFVVGTMRCQCVLTKTLDKRKKRGYNNS